MSWIRELLVGSSVGHIVLVFAFVIALGVALGRIKIFGVSLGMTFVLFVGIAVSHFGMLFPDLLFLDKVKDVRHFVDPEVLHFVREFGLILFVYAVGLQVGPGFFTTFKKGGLKLNLLAVAIVFLAVVITVAIHYITSIPIPIMVGILSGAITNTPGLGAAQNAYANMSATNDAGVIGTAYAMAYPLGVVGIISSIIAIRIIFRVNIDKENKKLLQAAKNNGQTATDKATKQHVEEEPQLIPIFVGILLGVILGSIPVYIPGVPQPVKLGLAGGPLVVAILMGAFGAKINFPTRITKSAALMLREVGICLFLACVGLIAGESFVETIVNGGGLLWVGLGVIITLVPLLIVGSLAYAVFKVDYFTVMGMLAGSTTDPPALSYSVGTAGNDKPSVGYATVYPLTMFLRIMTAQLLILMFA
jgi:AspT/YidE/YbjL antiporter-like protein